MWNFSVLLPLIIGDKIPDNEPLWSCYTLLLDPKAPNVVVKTGTTKVHYRATGRKGQITIVYC